MDIFSSTAVIRVLAMYYYCYGNGMIVVYQVFGAFCLFGVFLWQIYIPR